MYTISMIHRRQNIILFYCRSAMVSAHSLLFYIYSVLHAMISTLAAVGEDDRLFLIFWYIIDYFLWYFDCRMPPLYVVVLYAPKMLAAATAITPAVTAENSLSYLQQGARASTMQPHSLSYWEAQPLRCSWYFDDWYCACAIKRQVLSFLLARAYVRLWTKLTCFAYYFV